LSMQEMDSIPSGTRVEGTWTETLKPRIRFVRWVWSKISLQMINVESQTPTTVLTGYTGPWVIQAASIGTTASLVSTLKVIAMGRPVPRVPVSLFLGSEKVATEKTNEEGLVNFSLSFTEPGVYNYIAVIGTGEHPPLIIQGNPRAVSLGVTVWIIAVFCRNITDTWARAVGRAYFRGLPWIWWIDQPSSLRGIVYPSVDRPIGFIELIPCPQGVTIPEEVGNSAYCNTPEPYPPSAKCCEYARNTWWEMFLCATNDPKQVPQTITGNVNMVGGDRINLDYHLKYNITSSSVSYLGRYLKYQRCPWEAGTAPLDP